MASLNTRRGLRQAKSKGSFPAGGHGGRATFALDNRRHRSASVGSNVASALDGMKNGVTEVSLLFCQATNIPQLIGSEADCFIYPTSDQRWTKRAVYHRRICRVESGVRSGHGGARELFSIREAREKKELGRAAKASQTLSFIKHYSSIRYQLLISSSSSVLA